MHPRRRLLLLVACCAVGLCVSALFGRSFSDRHSSHAGFHRIEVADRIDAAFDLRRPRQTALVVFDGLGYLEAQTMRSLSLLQAHGQCRKTHVGPSTMSRPVYAVLSTGLEPDRTGARGNDDTTPMAAQSLWEVARAAGLGVSVVSELPWWRELFPDTFDKYLLAERGENFFRLAPPADLRLIHPLYVDETGHEHGAGSSQYQAAVARADRELSEFLATLDLSRDLVIVTADHGHSLHGGHGGQQDRVAHVLTCHAGVGVRHVPEQGALDATTIAPSLALLLGLPFPANMRAGDDDLDTLWEIADPDAFPAGYLEDRRAAVERFRGENQAQLRSWMPASAGSWDRFHARSRWKQVARALPCLALLIVVFMAQRRLHRVTSPGSRHAASFGAGFVVAACLLVYALQVGLRGSFDLSSVAFREEFLRFTVLLGIGSSLGAIGLHLLVWRSVAALIIDWSALSAVGTTLCLAHPLALGWQVGYPAPTPALFFFPYFAALVLGAHNGAGLLLAAVAALRGRT